MQTEFPTDTPWGPPTRGKLLAPGIIAFTTATHGGIWLSPEMNAKVSEALKLSTFQLCGFEGWYEQDLDAKIVLDLFGPFPEI